MLAVTVMAEGPITVHYVVLPLTLMIILRLCATCYLPELASFVVVNSVYSNSKRVTRKLPWGDRGTLSCDVD